MKNVKTFYLSRKTWSIRPLHCLTLCSFIHIEFRNSLSLVNWYRIWMFSISTLGLNLFNTFSNSGYRWQRYTPSRRHYFLLFRHCSAKLGQIFLSSSFTLKWHSLKEFLEKKLVFLMTKNYCSHRIIPRIHVPNFVLLDKSYAAIRIWFWSFVQR